MGDTMLLGVLRMPMDNPSSLELMQFVSTAREAADRIETDRAEIERLKGRLHGREVLIDRQQAEIERLKHEYEGCYEAFAKLTGACADRDEVIAELRKALEDACLTYSQYGEQPPEKWLAALAQTEDK
jgi:chromosome segregation ATPase